jgi:hypothetical protein
MAQNRSRNEAGQGSEKGWHSTMMTWCGAPVPVGVVPNWLDATPTRALEDCSRTRTLWFDNSNCGVARHEAEIRSLSIWRLFASPPMPLVICLAV